MLTNEKQSSWYKEPWPLFMVFLLLATIIYCGVRLHKVIVNKDYTIVDNYYTYGQSINQNLANISNAKSNNINATLYIDNLLAEVQLTLTGNLTNWPQNLKLKLVSSAFENHDVECSLQKVSINTQQQDSIKYTGQLAKFAPGTYYVYLQPDSMQTATNSWLLTTKTKINTNFAINISSDTHEQ